jgi:hypothetical protein
VFFHCLPTTINGLLFAAPIPIRVSAFEKRLSETISPDHARQVIARNFERGYPETNRNVGGAANTERQERIGQDPVDAELVGMLMARSAAVLLVACANVASLLVSRARVRSREIGLRLAIGADVSG